MRHMTRRDVLERGVDVRALVVEEDVGAERAQEFALFEAAQKERLVDPDVPGAKGSNYTLVRRRAARGDERGANGTAVFGKVGLDAMQPREEFLERAAGERLQSR